MLSYPAGSAVRPTAQRTRASLFSSLGELVPGAVFADLFAGAGGVGIEALSRGARFVHFVESSRDAVDHLRRNLASLAIEAARCRVYHATVASVLDQQPCPFADATLVFADAPYEADVDADLLQHFRAAEFVRLEMLVVEHRTRRGVLPPEGMVIDRARRFGDTTLSYIVPDGE